MGSLRRLAPMGCEFQFAPRRCRSFTASSPLPNAVYPVSKVKLPFERSIVECPVKVAADVQTAGGE